MVANKKPQRHTVKKAEGVKPTAKIMDHQDTVHKGDSRAVRTARTSFTTTPEILDALTDAAYERRMPRSQLIEECIVEHLGLEL